MPITGPGVPSSDAIQGAIDEGDDALAALLALLPVRAAAGSVTVSLAAASSGSATITFPAGRFTVAPLLYVSLANTGGGPQYVVRGVNSTTSGALAVVYNAGLVATGSVLVNWFAVQMTETTAAG